MIQMSDETEARLCYGKVQTLYEKDGRKFAQINGSDEFTNPLQDKQGSHYSLALK